MRAVLRASGHLPRVAMQVTGKTAGSLGGVDEAIAILKLGADDWSALAVHALYEGDRIEPRDTVLTIEGHALIASFGGDTVKATLAFAEHAGNDVPVVALVDYENDSVRTSLAVARALEGRLWGVRLDTSEHLVDRSLLAQRRLHGRHRSGRGRAAGEGRARAEGEREVGEGEMMRE